MRRILSAVAWLSMAQGFAFAGEVTLRNYVFRVPEGFTVELAASSPTVTYPICGDFDERGRLYVCESSGSAEWNKPQPKETLHRVLRLEDADGDGVFEKRIVYAEFEMMAQGAMWLDGSLYVAAAPVVWRLTDTDDDGRADRREEWIKTDAVTGCLNDLRGPYLGPDGYVYVCKGPATQTHSVGGKPWTTSARHVLRRHPHGSDVEQLMVGGMDNPVEVAFARDGERFVTCTNFQMLGLPRADGILHAVHGTVYPKDIGPVFEYPWTGPDLMRPMASWTALSPAGLMCYRSQTFGPEYRGNLFSALFSGHKVQRHVLSPNGATFASRDEDFLATENVEFHPTDVLEDADGSLIVIETGGWYKHCCPSSTFYLPDVQGAIYRIRKTDAAKIADPRGRDLVIETMPTEAAVKLLSDRRPIVARRAIERLGKLRAAAVPALHNVIHSTDDAEARLNAVWALARIDDPAARVAVRDALDDRDAAVRRAALDVVSLYRDREALEKLQALLVAESPVERRLAAECLGRIGDASAVPLLFKALASADDRFLDHALIFALIEIADADATRAGLANVNLAVRRGAMIALDQMPGGKLEPQPVVAALDAADPKLQDAAWWIVSRHAQAWGGLLAERLRTALNDTSASNEQRAQLKQRLARLARAPGLSTWIVGELTAAGVSAETRMLLLEAMGDAGGQFAEPGWVEALLTTLGRERDDDLKARLIATLGKLPPVSTKEAAGKQLAERLRAGLLASAHDADLSPEARVRALAAVRDKSLGKLDPAMFDFLRLQLAPEQPLGLRSSAAEALARANLDDDQLRRLAGGMKNLAATELNALLPLFQGKTDPETGRRLASSLLGSSAATSLNAYRLRTVLADFGDAIATETAPLFARLEQAQGEQLAKAARVAELVAAADSQRGMQVFQSQKTACVACHKTAHLGGIIGPHLQGLGKRRTERDLIESVLFPSASIVQSFESWTVVTDDGRTLTGVVIEDRPDEIVLAGGVDKIYRLPRQAIDEMVRSEQSIMPTGLDKNLSERDLADLVAYLKSL